MLFFIWTEEYGFETEMFDKDTEAVAYVERLQMLRAYEAVSIWIRECTSDDLLAVTRFC